MQVSKGVLMRSVGVVTVALAFLGNVALLPALSAGATVEGSQDPVINRSAPMTLTGEIVDISCYKQKGVAAGTGRRDTYGYGPAGMAKGAVAGLEAGVAVSVRSRVSLMRYPFCPFPSRGATRALV